MEAELDEMWGFVKSKKEQRWLWHAIDHKTGEILAYVLSGHKDEAFLRLKELLEPFGITQYYTPHSAGSSRDKVVFLAGRAKKSKNMFVIGG